MPAPTDDEAGHELYNLRAKAFIGCALVDLNDPTFLAQAAWSVYGTPGEPDQNDVAVMASDFKKLGRRHGVFPLDAAINRSWLKDGSMATNISGLVTLPTIQLNSQAMGQSRVLFFNGNKRRRACRLYAKYFDIRLQKVDVALEQLQRDPSTASPAVIQTLEAHKSTLRHAATRSGLWVTRLYDICELVRLRSLLFSVLNVSATNCRERIPGTGQGALRQPRTKVVHHVAQLSRLHFAESDSGAP